MIKRIMIDVDGVIADFDSHALTKLVGEANVAEARATRPKGEWSIAKGLGISEAEFWRRVDDVFFWQTIPPVEGAVDFVRTLYATAKEHYNVQDFYYCTCSGGSSNFPTARTQWIREFNKKSSVHIPLIIVQNSEDKTLFANSETLLIEDNERTVRQFMEAGGYAVMVPRQWNSGVHNPAIGSVYDQVMDDVRRGLGGLANTDIDR